MRVPRLTGLLCCLALPLTVQAEPSCLKSTAEPLAEYRNASPLMPITPENVLSVKVLADGCVLTRFPAYFRAPGLGAERLGKHEVANLRRELQKAEIASLDTAQLSNQLAARRQQKASDALHYYVSDEPLIEIELYPALDRSLGKRSKTLETRTLRRDLLDFPDDDALLSLAAVERLFEDFIERRVARQSALEVQP